MKQKLHNYFGTSSVECEEGRQRKESVQTDRWTRKGTGVFKTITLKYEQTHSHMHVHTSKILKGITSHEEK